MVPARAVVTFAAILAAAGAASGEDACLTWVRTHDGPGGGPDIGTEIALTGDGGLIVAGTATGPTGLDIVLLRLDTSGGIVWERRYDGQSGLRGDDVVHDMAVGPNGRLHVVGSSDGVASDLDYVTLVYEPDGTFVWLARKDHLGGHRDVPASVAVAADGRVYVTGSSFHPGRLTSFLTVAYTPEGQEDWTQSPSQEFGAEAAAVGVDAEGLVYAMGTELIVGGFSIIQYAPEGKQIWRLTYGGDRLVAGHVAPSGLYVLTGFDGDERLTVMRRPEGGGWGFHERAGFGATAMTTFGDEWLYVTGLDRTRRFAYTARYEIEQPNHWSLEYIGPDGETTSPFDVTVDAAGRAIVVGLIRRPPQTDGLLFKYSTIGNLFWEAFFVGRNGVDDELHAVVTDDAGVIYATGASGDDLVVVRYDLVERCTCPDLDGDGLIDMLDLLLLLAEWGTHDPCPPYRPEDFDRDCVVGFADLLVILGAWGGGCS